MPWQTISARSSTSWSISYNASQDNVKVNATFQGSYDDTYNALLAAFEAGTAPNITQNFDLAAQTMIDTGQLVPAWQLMAAGDGDAYLAAPRRLLLRRDRHGGTGLQLEHADRLLQRRHVRSRRRRSTGSGLGLQRLHRHL